MSVFRIEFYLHGAQPVMAIAQDGEIFQAWCPDPEIDANENGGHQMRQDDAVIPDLLPHRRIAQAEFDTLCRAKKIDPDVKPYVADLTEPMTDRAGIKRRMPIFNLLARGAETVSRLFRPAPDETPQEKIAYFKPAPFRRH